jgi:hypothetical protein
MGHVSIDLPTEDDDRSQTRGNPSQRVIPKLHKVDLPVKPRYWKQMLNHRIFFKNFSQSAAAKEMARVGESRNIPIG